MNNEKLTITTRAPGRLREDSYELALEISGGGTITPKALIRPLGGIVQRALYRAQDDLVQAITLQARMNDPVAQLDGKAQRLALLDTLPATLEFTLVAIPNGYCKQSCCAHLPWYTLNTAYGRITFGWCKRVIAIDWADSKIWKTAAELFPAEDVTKEDRSIHAWGLEKAKEYFGVLFGWADSNIRRQYVSKHEHGMLYLDLHSIMGTDKPFTADELETMSHSSRYSKPFRDYLKAAVSHVAPAVAPKED